MNNALEEKLKAWFEKMPVVAILRGVHPDEVLAIGAALYQAGIGIIEVPLNSPQPFESIRLLADAMGERCVIGAGTVVTVENVDKVAEVGGVITVTPNTNVDVIKRSIELGMVPMPGWASVTEAFAAYYAGARYLKLFPASTYGPDHIKAVSAVLPEECQLLAVGGVDPVVAEPWLKAGIRGFGIGSEIYRSGMSAELVAGRARSVVAAINKAMDRRQ